MAQLARFEHDFTDEAGNLLTGNVSVEVRRMTGGLPQLYSDREGASALGNPFVNVGGSVAFHADGNAYRVTVTQGAFSRELTYVALGLAGETDFTFARNQGNWSAIATYARGDYVVHGGEGIFISTQDGNLNHEPDDATPGSTAYWTYYPGLIGPAGTGDRFDLTLFAAGSPRAGETLVRHIFSATGVSFAAGLSMSSAGAEAASTGEAVFSIEKNGVEVGTVTFDTSDAGVFALASTTAFEQGDVLSVIAPSPRDATLADVSITIAGTRT